MNFLNMPRADAKSEPVPVARAAMCAQTTCGVCDRTMARLLSPAEYAGVLIEGRRLPFASGEQPRAGRAGYARIFEKTKK